MEMKMHKGQLAKILLLLSFLLLTPFISTSLRSPYLYFLFNLLIVVLGVDAGLLAAISKPSDVVIENNYKKPIITTATPAIAKEPAVVEAVVVAPAAVRPKKTVETKILRQSRPSIFFIGGCDEDQLDREEEASKKQVVVAAAKVAAKTDGDLISKQELFVKAEAFIGNFRKQLKMQREKSWKKIHGLCHRAF